ncbi:MAG: hypothetical protein GC180_13240 [Bacteroidetes bacterium]|nr:hypothetical protein [Bacteroidota bacterium]
MRRNKFLLFFMLLSSFVGKAQDLDYLCDSVLNAVVQESNSKLLELCPGYHDLKSAYDTTDVEIMNYQIGLRQKELEYDTRKSMKNLKRFAKNEHISLTHLEKIEYVYEVLSNQDGHKYAYVQARCVTKEQPCILHFVLIELNDDWFYGEGLRLEKLKVEKEVTPNYEQIDRELERRQEARELAQEKARLDAEKEKKKLEEEALKQKEKQERDSAKAAVSAKREKEKELREQERAEQKRIREEARKQREKEIEDARRKREEAKKQKEEERKEKEKQRELEKKEKERKAKEKEKEEKEKEKEKQKKGS